MPSSLAPSHRLLVFTGLLILGSVAGYAWRWQYVNSPGAPIVRVNRWTNHTEFLTDSGWTAITNDPFRHIGDRRP